MTETDDATAIAEAARAISRYAEGPVLFSLELPSGWFGRPHDNQHELTLLEARRHRLLVELDHQLLLSFAGAISVITDKSDTWISGFDQLVFDWSGYGDLTPHVETFSGGVVHLAP